MKLSLRHLVRPSARSPRWCLTWESHASTRGPAHLPCHAGTDPSPVPAEESSSTYGTVAVAQLPQINPAGPGHAVVSPVRAASELVDLPFYSQFPLDRRTEWRQDQTILDELFSRPDAKLIPLLRDKVLVRPVAAAEMAGRSSATASSSSEAITGDASSPLLQPVLLCPASAYADFATGSPARPFLGVDAGGAPYFTAATASPDIARSITALHPGAEWRAARVAGPDLAPGDAALLAVASGLMAWHNSNAFSAATGSPSSPTPGGFSRRCTAGGGSAYPRIDPAVIMLVSHQGFALLGRKAEWPADRYSTLAGFLELGEPLEAAVAREVEEEAGVRVDLASVTYAASQPWPFPRSLMIGFHAHAAAAVANDVPASANASRVTSNVSRGNGSDASSTSSVAAAAAPSARPWWQPAPVPARGFDLLPSAGRRAALDVGLFQEELEEILGPLQGMQWPVADQEELQDVRWFHRDWLRAVFRAPGGAISLPGAGRFNIPGPYSLAYRLISSWVGSCPGGVSQPVAAAAEAAAAGTQFVPWDGDVIPQVLISSSGTFKYILARLWDPRVEREGRSKLLVWGDVRASYHNDVLQKAKAMARSQGLQVTPLGGGRIQHDPNARALRVYGYSAAFGPAPHEVVAAILHRWFPLYEKQSITVSYDGY